MENNNYSPEYLDGIREKFPEYATSTNEKLIDILDANSERIFGVYEYEVESAFKTLEDEVIIEDGDQNFLDQIPQSILDRVNSGLLYIIEKNKWRWDLVLSVREEKNTEWWQSTVWSSISSDQISFVVDNKNKDYLSQSLHKKLVCILSVSPKNETDSLGRDVFILTPKLIEIPSKNTLLMQWMLFSKNLTANDFQNELHKFVS